MVTDREVKKVYFAKLNNDNKQTLYKIQWRTARVAYVCLPKSITVNITNAIKTYKQNFYSIPHCFIAY